MKKTDKERKPIVDYLMTSGKMLLFTVMFAFASFLFIGVEIHNLILLLMGALFIAPIVVLNFTSGKKAGEAEYKKLNKTLLSDVHTQRAVDVKLVKAVYGVLPYFALTVLSSLAAEIFGWLWLQGSMQILFAPTTLVFIGCGIYKTGTLTWLAFLSNFLYALLACGAYVFSYVVAVKKLRRRSAELVSEIRSYN